MSTHSVSARTLIAFALAAACASGAPASAATILVLERGLPPEVKITGTNFEVDEHLGLARLAVDFYDESFEGNLSFQSFDIAGLTFDRPSGEVRYESEGTLVTCARRKKFLWGTTYQETGACRVTVRSQPRVADAGFGESTRTGWVVEFATTEPTRSAGLKR